jgi:hypothetical protein
MSEVSEDSRRPQKMALQYLLILQLFFFLTSDPSYSVLGGFLSYKVLTEAGLTLTLDHKLSGSPIFQTWTGFSISVLLTF